MTTPTRPRRRRHRSWRLRLIAGLLCVLLALAFGGWLRGQRQWGPFRGQLVDAETGAPIAGAHVMVSWNVRYAGERLSRHFDARETITDARGHFELPRLWRLWTLNVLPPGIGYFAPGYAPADRIVTPPDGVPFVDPTVIALQPLETRQQRCRAENRATAPPPDTAPRFRAAVRAYNNDLRCTETPEPAP